MPPWAHRLLRPVPLRLLPLAIGVTVVAIAATRRIASGPRGRPPEEAAPAGVQVAAAPQDGTLGPGDIASVGARTQLRGPTSGIATGAVAGGPTRMLHGDPRRTHRAHGRGPHTPHVAWSV